MTTRDDDRQGDRPPPGPLPWEVFRSPRRGLAHQHVGTVRADDAATAARLARQAFGGSDDDPGALWLIPTARICASSPDRRAALFDPAADKEFRHPGHYAIPEGVKNL
jgi:ring-1,2-phenylacetyl-CoA epoxidase subunit PaaB